MNEDRVAGRRDFAHDFDRAAGGGRATLELDG